MNGKIEVKKFDFAAGEEGCFIDLSLSPDVLIWRSREEDEELTEELDESSDKLDEAEKKEEDESCEELSLSSDSTNGRVGSSSEAENGECILFPLGIVGDRLTWVWVGS